MELNNVKKKFEGDKKKKPIIKKTVIINPGRKIQMINEQVSLEEVIEENSKP